MDDLPVLYHEDDLKDLKSSFSSESKPANTAKVSSEAEKQTQVANPLKKSMIQITDYLSKFNPSQIDTPYKGNCFLLSEDESKFFIGTDEGEISIARASNKEIIETKYFGEKPIWTIATYQKEKFIFVAGGEGLIQKILLEDLIEVDKLEGHTNEINAIQIDSGKNKLYSTGDDCTVLMWDLNVVKPDPCKLYSHFEAVCGLDLSADGRYLASASKDKTLKIYDLDKGAIWHSLENYLFGEIWCVKITQKNTYIAFGDDTPTAYLYKFGTWELLRIFKGHDEEQRIRCISASLDEEIIITGGTDNLIYLWDTEVQRPGLKLSGHMDWVRGLIISKDRKYLHSISEDQSIKTWRLPNFKNYYIVPNDVKMLDVKIMAMGVKFPQNVYIANQKNIRKIDLENPRNNKMFELENILYCAVHPRNDLITVLILNSSSPNTKSSYEVINIDPTDWTHETIKKFETFEINCMAYSVNGELLIFGEGKICSIYNAKSFAEYKKFISHSFEVVNIAQTPDGKYLFSGDKEGCIRYYDILKKVEIKVIANSKYYGSSSNSDEFVIKDLLTTFDSEYLLVIYKNSTIVTCATSKMVKVNTLKLENIIKFNFPKTSSLLFCLMESYIKVVDICTLVTCFTLRIDQMPLDFCFSFDDKEIAVYFENEVHIYRNPLTTDIQSVYGDYYLIHEYYVFLGKLVSGNLKGYVSEINCWVVEPLHINTMHLYAYFNNAEYLKECIQDDTGFFESRSGFTPLDICLEMNHEACLLLLYTHIKRKSAENPLFLSLLGKSLNRIIENLCKNSDKLIDLMLSKTIDAQVFNYHQTKLPLPLIALSKSLLLGKDHSFLDEKNYPNHGKAIQFLQTYFKINMTKGSNDSISFIKSIILTNNNKVFSTEFIKILLREKWVSVWPILYLQAIVYMIYLVLLSGYSNLANIQLLNAVFVLNIILILYEIIQMATSGLSYFSDTWNYFDLLRSSLMTILFIEQTSGLEYFNDLLVGIVLFISWTRGIGYFRLISVTRYYINLIYRVIFDILPFLSIFFYSTIAFSLVFERLSHRKDTNFNYAKMSWEISLGGFDTSDFDRYMYAAFFFHTIINPIILLNLLISIMSYSFEKVNSNLVVADGKELAMMILEGELIYFWNRNNTDKVYFHVCIKKNLITSQDENTEVLLGMKKKIASMSKIQENLQVNIQKMLEDQSVLIKNQEEGGKIISAKIEEMLDLVRKSK